MAFTLQNGPNAIFLLHINILKIKTNMEYIYNNLEYLNKLRIKIR